MPTLRKYETEEQIAILKARVRSLQDENVRLQSIIDKFGSFLDHWTLKWEKNPNDVYKAWDDARK